MADLSVSQAQLNHSLRALASAIDHTLLKSETSAEEVLKACRDARARAFAAVVVRLPHLALVSRELSDPQGPAPACVVDFPEGQGSDAARLAEAQEALRLGARELDLVFDFKAWVRDSVDRDAVWNSVRSINELAHTSRAKLKLILETAALSDAQITAAAVLAKEIGVDFVKTSTGYGPGGATIQAVQLLRQAVGPGMGVKASGGIRTREFALELMAAGANRIGTSAGLELTDPSAGATTKAWQGESSGSY